MEKNKKVYIFDLDRTLIDVDKMKLDIAEEINISNEDESEWTKLILKNFFNEEKVKKFIKENINNYIFDSVPNILKKIRKESDVILMTKGNAEFQKFKVNSLTEINNFFNKEVYVDPERNETKWKEIQKIYLEDRNASIYSFNDSIAENNEFREKVPEIKVFDIVDFNISEVLQEFLEKENLEQKQEFKFK